MVHDPVERYRGSPLADPNDTEHDADPDELDPHEPRDRPGEARDRQGAGFRKLLSDQITGLLDPEGAIRKGQGIVTGVTQATKEEMMRIISAEVRSFLDKMDAVDLMQQVVSGLVVDVNMQVRFRRDGDQLQPEVTDSSTEIRSADAETDDEEPSESD